jgi:hypothetical protein
VSPAEAPLQRGQRCRRYARHQACAAIVCFCSESSSGDGVHPAGSNPSEGLERSYDWSYVRSLMMATPRPGLRPCPCPEASRLSPGKAMWGPRNAYDLPAGLASPISQGCNRRKTVGLSDTPVSGDPGNWWPSWMQGDCFVAKINTGLRIGRKSGLQRVSKPRLELADSLISSTKLGMDCRPRNGG